MERSLRVCWCVAIALCLHTVVVPATQSRVADALERYAAGDYAAAVADLKAGRSHRDAVREFQRDAGEWIARAPNGKRARQLAVTSAISLELLAAGVTGDADAAGTDYDDARPLVEWLCTLFQRESPSQVERLFHLASIAAFQWAHDEHMLIGGRPALGRVLSEHVRHAAERFPDESRFRLAWLTARHELMIISARPMSPGFLLDGHWPNPVDQDPRDGAARLSATLDAISLLANDPGVGMEARLRRGVLHFAMGEPATALPDFQYVVAAREPFLRYLAHVMLGLALERTGRLAEAPAHYANAVEIVPASSAVTALASSLFRLGREGEAADVLARYEGRPHPQDPWMMYSVRDYRFFPAYLAALRAVIKELGDS